MAKWVPRHIIISRIDSIGDVVLTFPMAHILKQHYPDARITLLGQKYTKEIGLLCKDIDDVVCWGEIQALPEEQQVATLKSLNADTIFHLLADKAVARLSHKAGISHRVGTNRRTYNWKYCNHLVLLQRQNSLLHEAQLNLKLLKPLLGRQIPELDVINEWQYIDEKPAFDDHHGFLKKGKTNIVVHPLSNGSGKEWPLEYYAELMRSLPADRFNFILTGTEKELEKARGALPLDLQNVQSSMGKLTITELCGLIAASDGLLAASTGPLHIAAVMKVPTVSIFCSRRSKGSRRWGPLSNTATVLHKPERCEKCKRAPDCACVNSFTPDIVGQSLVQLDIPVRAEAR